MSQALRGSIKPSRVNSDKKGEEVLKMRYTVFANAIIAALSGNARAASYAEILLKDKFDVHIRSMVAGGIKRKDTKR